eukprot:CAMPEP_0194520462 /NCGR_PEP_ID=MMETSP0253-20130528/54435_1 /TAXON_ID=2966 /ORGANISM="Noctiluca scintillans" /LENGTH=50 /DNA_ID=CAMNT_0039364703 /DNA_START=49 /DNA_END=201 /DNA_ORIENTATION=+
MKLFSSLTLAAHNFEAAIWCWVLRELPASHPLAPCEIWPVRGSSSGKPLR